MKLSDELRVTGRVNAYTFDGDLDPTAVVDILSDRTRPEWRRLAGEYVGPNIVTNVGRAQMTRLIVAETTAVATHIALSTTAVTPAVTDTVATITDRISTVGLTIAQSYLSVYQRYVAYFITTSFSSTGVATEALLDSASTAAATNLWADAVVTVSKSSTQSLIVEHQILAST